MRTALALSILLLAACHDHEEAMGTGHEPEEYLGCAADELWPMFDAQRANATTNAAAAPSFTAPSVTAPLSKTDVPTFTWLKKPGATSTPDGDVPSSCAQWSRGALDTAHLPPISGTAYDLELTVGGSPVYRVITTLERWKPPASAWASFAGKTVTLTIWEAPLTNNQPSGAVTTSGAPLVFTVAP